MNAFLLSFGLHSQFGCSSVPPPPYAKFFQIFMRKHSVSSEQACWIKADTDVSEHKLSLDRAFILRVFKNRYSSLFNVFFAFNRKQILFSLFHDLRKTLLTTCLQFSGRDDSLKSPTCVDLVNNCPHLTSLALRGCKLHDYKVRILVKVFSCATRKD